MKMNRLTRLMRKPGLCLTKIWMVCILCFSACEPSLVIDEDRFVPIILLVGDNWGETGQWAVLYKGERGHMIAAGIYLFVRNGKAVYVRYPY